MTCSLRAKPSPSWLEQRRGTTLRRIATGHRTISKLAVRLYAALTTPSNPEWCVAARVTWIQPAVLVERRGLAGKTRSRKDP